MLAYDDLHRLKTATGLWGSYGYVYDPLNNLRSRTGPNALTYSYNATTNRLSGISGSQTRSYGYNARGEITGDGIKSFTLNAKGQISSITGIASYGYDGNGKRIKTVKGSNTEYALYDQAGHLVYTEQGTTKTDYLSLNGQTLVELKKVGSTTTPTYLHPDLLGSPRKATDAAGTILWDEHYDPYGQKLNGVAEKIGYTGHAFDPESNLTYMQARFFDPLVGRFLSTDPVYFSDESPFTFNRYSYADNNPYRYTDPSGQWVDTAVDVGFIAYDAGRFIGAVAAWADGTLSGNEALANVGREGMAETGVDFGASTVSAVIPGVAAPLARGVASEARVLKAIGETKNTEKVVTSHGKTIPDFQNARQVGDIKDTKRVSDTAQMKAQREHAQATGREHVVVTGENTKVTAPLEQKSTVIRRDDLGPKKDEP